MRYWLACIGAVTVLAGIGIYGWDGAKWQRMNVDDDSDSLVMIDETHHLIHEGKHFFIVGYDDLAISGTTVFALTTPAGSTRVHMTFLYSADGSYTLEVYENASVTGGTATTPVNNDRNSSNTSSVTVVKNPTVSSNGDLLEQIKVGSNVKFAGTEQISRENEMILKPSTTYLYRVTANEALTLTYKGTWYEVP